MFIIIFLLILLFVFFVFTKMASIVDYADNL